MKKLLVILTMALGLWTSCSKDSSSSTYTPSCNGTAKSYATDVAPLIQAYCGGCHNFNSYSTVAASANSIRSMIASGQMPRGGSLTNAQKDIIVCWIDNGAKNN